ncbi:hypothetical protein [Stappia stellulata]|uniref:hypothetical protein n=1 Tax=Stappia stellulata TaxID=71235 RepID=UPI0012EB0902|nr:hypothetical protein [Stappia stellulata]
MTSIAGLKGAQDRFETSARRIVAAGAEAGNRLAQTAQGSSGAGVQATDGPEPVRGARAIGFSPDMAGAMVDMMQAENAFSANAAVAGRISDMQKAYLDVLGSTRKER